MGTPGAESAAPHALSWTRTIDRTLVHRDAIAEVLLTDLVQLSDTGFLVAAQWPRSHRVYRPDPDGRHDPMLILETVRQTGLALSHFGFGVEFDQQSVMRDVGFDLDPETEPRALQGATNLSIAVECRNIQRRGNGLRSMTVVLHFAADGAGFAVGTGTISWLSARTYSALRARSGAQVTVEVEIPNDNRPKPSGSGYRSAADSLIAPVPTAGPIRELMIPLGHPVYFDHPLDHAPGMLLVDAAWQAAAAMHGEQARLVGCLMECPAFTELNLATSIELRSTAGDTTQFSVEQGGRETASGMFRISG